MDLAEFPSHFAATFPALVGRRVLVAFSGGADSVALLHLLRHRHLELELEAAHVHHGIRGAEADEDASSCARHCRELAIPFHLLHLPEEAPLHAGREGTWRRLRYHALLELARTGELSAVATGHHRDDVAEGVLVQLLRGGGPRALAGIATETTEGVIRPLLPWNRPEILAWLEERQIPWREDSSNLNPQHLRNRVRHRLLPELLEASPSLREHLVHLAESLAESEAFFAGELKARARWIDPWEPDGGVPAAAIRELAAPLRARWLHAQAARVGIERVTRRQLQLFHTLIDCASPTAVSLGHRWRLRLARRHLWLEPPQPPAAYDLGLVPGEIVELPLPGWQIRIRETPGPEAGLRWRWRPPTGVGLGVRNTRPGERVEVNRKEVPVQRLLAKSLPRHLRRAWPVFCEDDKIYWIPGVWQAPAASSREDLVVEVIRR